MDIFVIENVPGRYAAAMKPFADAGFHVVSMRNTEEAEAAMAMRRDENAGQPALVVIDASSGMTPRALREQGMRFLRLSAFTYLSVVTSMTGAEFHDAMEGLGMLPPLPADPGEADGRKLVEALLDFVEP
ncbi:MAG: hypothetical protein J5838_02450 [Desulfovibrio sp.]|nr:hypothetical protein [Desulfovibrio sp.]